MSANKFMIPPVLEQSYERLRLAGEPFMRPARCGNRRRWYVRVRCVCGTEKEVRCDGLTSGLVESCGCLRKERALKATVRHGQYSSKLYTVWSGMKSRCYYSNSNNYHNYGARGIRVCDAWRHDFAAFSSWAIAKGYREGLEIDRIDNDGPYSPENCRLSDRSGQMRNARSTLFIEAFGETKSAAAWLEDPRCVIRRPTLQARLRTGWPPELALTLPPSRENRKLPFLRATA